MPFVVAAPAAVIGGLGALWVTLTLLIGLEAGFLSGVILGLGAFVLLAVSHGAPVARVTPPRWRRSLLLGLLCGVALWLVSVAAIGPIGSVAGAVVGGLACAMADRRTTATRRATLLHRALLVLLLLVTLERLTAKAFFDNDPYAGLGALCAVIAAAFIPMDRIRRWTAERQPVPAKIIYRDFGGYRAEALALAAFLEPVDVPKSLLIETAHEIGAGKAGSLRGLAATAMVETGPDSLNVNPQAQEFARQRMLADERRWWTARAVRMLTEAFPPGPWASAESRAWCERLMPHALALSGWAEKHNVERGAMALLLDEVAGYLAEAGRLEDARSAAALAVAHAAAGFGPASPEVATLHARLEQPQQTAVDRAELAHQFALLGDGHRDTGDLDAARRDYRTALVHARSALGGRHELVGDLRARLAALPAPARDESNERRLVIGCFSLVVASVLICVGAVVLRGIGDGRMRASEDALARVEQLAELCASSPRYFPAADAFAGAEPHPVRLFRKSNNDSEFTLEPYTVAPAAPSATQLVGCVTQTRTGPNLATCKYPDRPEIPLHQATYVLSIYETRTGAKLGTQTLTATHGECPPSYQPPPETKPWMLYAAPADDQYRQAILLVEDLLIRPSSIVQSGVAAAR
ncbi:hypothetical protein [Allorhizocola rhizosphaerae]|uniref:hypothetical protein n=1 Tax=Allorhizocola rhizosphaerae TaxID=1872709 RepID=UPI000E3C1473|nr:hypothetical protein [Allorhizocola rhizosphaerae]